jgi:hypothetical protein
MGALVFRKRKRTKKQEDMALTKLGELHVGNDVPGDACETGDHLQTSAIGLGPFKSTCTNALHTRLHLEPVDPPLRTPPSLICGPSFQAIHD